MPEESSVTVSLEDLERAAEGIINEEKVTTPEGPPKPLAETPQEDEEDVSKKDGDDEEPADNIARSKLGRKVAALESTIQSFIEEMRSTMKKPDVVDTTRDDEPEDYDLDAPVTKREFNELLEKREIAKKANDSKYISEYNAQFDAFKRDSEDADLHDQIMAEMVKNYNVKRSQNGSTDARLNYMEAEIAVLRTARKTPKNPLEKNKDKQPANLGTPSGTNIDVKGPSVLKLDEDTQGLVDYFRSQDPSSWPDEKVASIVNREPSLKHMRHSKG